MCINNLTTTTLQQPPQHYVKASLLIKLQIVQDNNRDFALITETSP